MDWVNIIVSILSGLAVAIPLVVELIKYVKKAVKEKNWTSLVNLITQFMAEAELLFASGEERKNYVMIAIKASADTVNYQIDMDVVSALIDSFCEMSKVVNFPKEETKETEV